jgi:hypothetical protein
MNIFPPLNTNSQNIQMYSQPIQPVVQQYMPRQRKNSFPRAYTILQIIFFIVLCLAMIALQTVITIYNFASYPFGAGFWVAAYFIGAIVCLFNIRKFILIVFLFLLLKQLINFQVKNESECVKTTTIVLHYFGVVVALGGLVVLNALAVESYGGLSEFII